MKNPTTSGRVKVAFVVAALILGVLAFQGHTSAASAQIAPYPVGTSDAAEPSGMAPPDASALTGYNQIYTQDFAGTALPTEWPYYSGQPGGDPGAIFGPSHVSVSSGMLQIATYQDPAFNNQWVTGGTCLCGEPGLLYGAFFVRSRITGPGDDDAELLWPDANVWPPEIDFNETYGTDTATSSTIHWGNNSQQHLALTIDMTQWHTWGIIWTPTSVIYTVDGQQWGAITNASEIPTIPMHLSIQSQTFCSTNWACPINGTTNTEQVDWVAEYQIPQGVTTTTTTSTTATAPVTTTTQAPPPLTTTTQKAAPTTTTTLKKAPPRKRKLTAVQRAAARKRAVQRATAKRRAAAAAAAAKKRAEKHIS